MKTATENYKGFTIEISHDDSPENPFKAWDGNLPLMKINDRWHEDYSDGDIGEYLSEVLTDGQILRHQKELAEALEIDIEDYEDKNDKISDIRYEIQNSKDFDALETICILSKTPYLNTCSRGYLQRDYADIFTCYTAKFEQETGCSKAKVNENMLQEAVNLWGYWAWGDVYGYSVEGQDGELIDSCWGYYGDDHDKSGLLDSAKVEIDAHIKWKRKQKIQKVKELIKAKVPYSYRQRIIANI